MTKLPGNLRRGGTSFIMPRWRAGGARLAVDQRMTTLAGVPTQLALMLREPDFDAYDLDSVRFLVVGGGPITRGSAEEARRASGAPLATRYSCTEAGIGLGTAFDDPEEDAIVSVGRPHPASSSACSTTTTGRSRRARSARCASLPAVMSGYWRDPDATRAAFTADGFVRTGDLGWVDDRGRLRLVGRTKEMYVRGGYNVYPVEVEAVLSTHPAVAAWRSSRSRRPVMGEIGVAVVVRATPHAPPSLDATARVRHAAPRRVQAPRGARRRRSAPADRDGEGRPRCSPSRDLPSEHARQVEARPPWNSSSPTEQDELRDGVRAVLARECPITPRARGRRRRRPARRPVEQMVELGWPALTVPERRRRRMGSSRPRSSPRSSAA